MTHNPRILGVAGGGLKDASWLTGKNAAATARIGEAGEVRTAGVLNALTEPVDGPTVLHDLMVPSSRYKANLDHIVVNGSTVHVIDAKVWKPGRYWTVGGKTRRGWSRFEPADKQTMVIARQSLDSFFANRGIVADVITPTLVVWPSSTRAPLRLGMLRVAGAEVWHADSFEARINRLYGNGGTFARATRRPANPLIVDALAELLVSKRRSPSTPDSPLSTAAPVFADPPPPRPPTPPSNFYYDHDDLPAVEDGW